MPTEREITEPVRLTRADGRLNPAAVGWSRTPLHDTSGIGRGRVGWGRNKRWEYWAVCSPEWVVAVVVSDISYAAVPGVFALNRLTGEQISVDGVVPLARGTELPGSLDDGVAHTRAKGLDVRISPEHSGTRIEARTERIALDVVAELPAGHERLGVVVPWSERLFQYTVKDPCRPVSGRVVVDGAGYELPAGESWATLDHGRGRWPYAVTWQWGSGSGRVDGHVVGLQVGGRWTEGTGSTENALVVDGRLTKIGAELRWDFDSADWMRPWRVRGQGVNLEFRPEHLRKAVTQLGVLSSKTHQAFGTWHGSVGDLGVDGLFGWAEDVHQRW